MAEQSAIVDDAERECDHEHGVSFEGVLELDEPPVVPARKGKSSSRKEIAKVPTNKKTRTKPRIATEEGEFFDLDAISASSDFSSSPHRSPTEIKPKATAPRPRGRPPGSKSKSKQLPALRAGVSRDSFDIDEFSSTSGVATFHETPPSERRKVKTQSGAGVRTPNPLASMAMNVDIPMASPSRSVASQRKVVPRKRSRKRSIGRTTDADVIEISE